MAIAFGTQGTTPSGTGIGTGTTSVTPGAPSGLTTGDICLIFVANKPETAVPSTPTNWSLAGTVVGGGGTAGADAGPVRLTCFFRVKDATWSIMPAITISGANGSWAQAFRYTNATGLWDVAAASGADTGSNTTFGITASSNPGLTTGDWAVMGAAVASDIGTWSAQSFNATGIGVSARTERAEPKTSQGNDIGGCVWDASVTSGTATANPTFGGTLSSSTGSTGVGLLVRLRELAPPGDDWTEAPADTMDLTDSASVMQGLGEIPTDAMGLSDDFAVELTTSGPIGMTVLTAGSDTTNGQTTYTTSSFTHSANKLICAFIVTAAGSSPSPTPSMSGHGISWELQARPSDSARSEFLFVGVASSAFTGTLDINIPDTTATNVLWSIMELTGADLTGTASSAIQQTKASTFSSGLSPVSLTFDSSVNPDNAVVFGVQSGTEEDLVPGTGLTEIHDIKSSAPATSLMTAWAAAAQNTVSASGMTSVQSRAIAIEVKRGAGAGGATQHAVNQTDALGLDDSAQVVHGQGQAVADSMGLSDTTTRAQGHAQRPSDALGLTDATTLSLARVQTASDAMGLTDSVQVDLVRDLGVSATDALGLTDQAAASQGYGIRTTDAENLTDSTTISQGYGVQASDAEGLTDAASVSQGYGVRQTDTLGLADAVQLSQGWGIRPTDALGLSDAVSTLMGLARNVTDAVGITDSAAVSVGRAASTTDSIGLTDAVSVILARSLTQANTDAMGLTDSVSVFLARSLDVSPTDALNLSDSAQIAQIHRQSDADAMGLTDTVEVELLGMDQVAPVNAMGMTDSVVIALFRAVPVADPMNMTDSTVLAMELVRTTSDAMGLSDAVRLSQGHGRSTVDALGLSDSAVVSRDLGSRPVDAMGITDLVALVQQHIARPQDTLGLADTVSISQALVIQDALGLTDAATVDLIKLMQVIHADNMSLSDTILLARALGVRVTDNMGLADSLRTVHFAFLAVADDMMLTDAIDSAMQMRSEYGDSLGLFDDVDVRVAPIYVPATEPTADIEVGGTDYADILIADEASGILDGEGTAVLGMGDSNTTLEG